MNKIGLSFYAAFIVLISAVLVAVATLADVVVPFAEPEAKENVAQAEQTFVAQQAQSVPEPVPAQRLGGPAIVPARVEVKLAQNANAKTEETLSEAAYRARLTRLITPLAKLELSKSDRTAFDAARKAVRARNRNEARAQQAKLKDPAARKLVNWLLLRAGYGRSEDFRKFLAESPLWPDRRLIQRRFEQSLFVDGGSARKILGHFEKTKPAFDAGLAAMASAHLALNNTAQAKALAGQAWCGGGIAIGREKAFLARFQKHITSADHRCRLDRLLVANIRWNSRRKVRGNAIRRLIPMLDKAEQAKATARLSMFLRQKAAPKFLAKVPKAQRKGDWGFQFQYIQHLRRARKHSAAWQRLKAVPVDPKKIVNPDAWWEERHANALNALKAGKKKLAYDMVADIRPESVNPAKEQAFFAGWIALTKLGKPKLALGHIERMRALADGPLSTSKAEYWLGRIHAKLAQEDKARQHYAAAGGYRDTFHGLLARQTMAPNDNMLTLPMPALPSQAQVAGFLQNDAVRAAVIARKVGLPRGNVLNFFRAIARRLETEAEVALLAQLASVLGDGQAEVRVGKIGVVRRFHTYIYSYPIARLPDYKPLRQPPEQAMVLAIARQESEFNTAIVSSAGARGILQVMPITARHICRQYKIKCRLNDLLTKPAYNARIATAYIADRTDDFGGSYILTFTGYNAGPGRTREWLRKIGDPRNPRVEPLDWIYRIPFEETRKYAQKVLSNVQVYRARLGEKNPLRLRHDMNRATKR